LNDSLIASAAVALILTGLTL